MLRKRIQRYQRKSQVTAAPQKSEDKGKNKSQEKQNISKIVQVRIEGEKKHDVGKDLNMFMVE